MDWGVLFFCFILFLRLFFFLSSFGRGVLSVYVSVYVSVYIFYFVWRALPGSWGEKNINAFVFEL